LTVHEKSAAPVVSCEEFFVVRHTPSGDALRMEMQVLSFEKQPLTESIEFAPAPWNPAVGVNEKFTRPWRVWAKLGSVKVPGVRLSTVVGIDASATLPLLVATPCSAIE
jgi:hypothetical protein